MSTTTETNEAYHADTSCISTSMLKLFRESIQKYYKRYVTKTEVEPPRKRELTLGTLAHAAILEPERWEKEFVSAPAWTRGNRRLLQKYTQEFDGTGVTVVSYDDARAVTQIAQAAQRVAGKLLALDGVVEQSIRVQDPETGLWMKIRPDKRLYVPERGLFVPALLDIKSTYEPDERQFLFTAKRFLYALQEVHYVEVVELEYGVKCDFHFIVVQSKKPYDARLYRMPDGWRQGAKALRRKLLRELAECYASGKWNDRPSQMEQQPVESETEVLW